MSAKAIICDDRAAWDAHDAVARAGLSIPNAHANIYSCPYEVTNSESADFGKFIFLVMTSGNWKCDQLFESSDVIDWNPDWFDNPIE
jgi:hypothetical protein